MAKEELIDITEMDLVVENAERIDALIELLIEKKIISKKDYEEKLEKISKFD